ncbi:MAG: hypothetical protein H0W96_17380, partial [Solirubrobacterales bacterium]|nr:hypothetical protein [Solirubrobacterales bacterium]
MRKSLTAAAAVTAALAVAPAAFAWGGGSYGGWDGGGSDLKAASYINGDAGKNADVDPNSSCFRPDQYDMQAFSSAASGNPGDKNVHNDACFLDDRGNKVGKNIGATFQSRGTGYISACPDPDGAGPAIAILRDLNADGRNDSCFQSSYQEKGIAGDFEYHARVNNTGMAGSQDVKWGMDRDADGRIDGR